MIAGTQKIIQCRGVAHTYKLRLNLSLLQTLQVNGRIYAALIRPYIEIVFIVGAALGVLAVYPPADFTLFYSPVKGP
jgi:hypothetical protein